ncbi:HU family DNA-binding protein [Priestia megaterium]|uniref:HU family DNA-binding protein n=1 Tax=Priestia megaterium TaxID=1404 RepID=UPI002D8089F0|nr:HU family DNA-binding protein [Priestia megaterium]MEB4860960.1 HU family DNA-binding protein [Priestia megaterium]
MDKDELIEVMVSNSLLTKAQATTALNMLNRMIYETLAEGEKFHLAGLGTFDAREIPELKRPHPETGEEITIPARKIPVFKPDKVFSEAFN